MSKLKLNNVTLIAIAGNKQGETITSMYKSMSKVDFHSCKLLTNKDLIISDIECINVGGLNSWEEYNRFIVKELYKYFDTEYCLLVQWDSWVLDADCWDDEFLNYDLIGAKWLDLGKPFNVGNGGFTLRSKKIQKILGTDENIQTTCPEDTAICKVYGQYLIDKYGIKFATEEVADKFSFELNMPLNPTFGFHAFHQEPYKKTIVIKRSHALGDVIMAEPVLFYFYKKGYRVVLDTQDQFYGVYSQHYFQVIPKKYLPPNLEYEEINLDMIYECSPKRNVLESYYEIAGIKGEPLRNSILHLNSGSNEKLFKKYALIHIDNTGMEYRNQHGIKWESVVSYLQDKGYLVFQIGRRIDKEIAPYLNTMSLEFMMFVVKGADLVIGLDSGVAQVAVGFNVPTVIMFGSVNPVLRYHNFENISIVQSECPSEEHKHCYHQNIGEVGKECIYDAVMPPCTTYTATQVINAIKIII